LSIEDAKRLLDAYQESLRRDGGVDG